MRYELIGSVHALGMLAYLVADVTAENIVDVIKLWGGVPGEDDDD